MTEQDLKIGESGDVYVVTAVGRANFEYAVPIRELVNSNEGRRTIRVDLKACTAMDSTFMGVLSMGGLKAADNGSAFEIYNASPALRRSLADLGVDELFDFCEGSPGTVTESAGSPKGSDMLAAAETVEEAHRKLVEADSANESRFRAVIDLAAADVEKLKQKKEE